MANLFTSKDPAMTAAGQLAVGTYAVASMVTDLMQPLFSLPQSDNTYSVGTMTAVMSEANKRINSLNATVRALGNELEEIAAVAADNREYVIDLELKAETAMAEVERLREELAAANRGGRRRPAVSISGPRL